MTLPIIKVIAWTCNIMRHRTTAINSLQCDYDCDHKLQDHRRKNIPIPVKIVYTTKLLGFKVPTLNSGFKISEDLTKPGSFYFGFEISRQTFKSKKEKKLYVHTFIEIDFNILFSFAINDDLWERKGQITLYGVSSDVF